MAEFDREELKAAFETGKIAISDEDIRRLDGLLRALAQQYRARRVAREQAGGLDGVLSRAQARLLHSSVRDFPRPGADVGSSR
jgi:hypothetical protein